MKRCVQIAYLGDDPRKLWLDSGKMKEEKEDDEECSLSS